MLLPYLLVLLICRLAKGENASYYYDTYSGLQLTDEQYQERVESGLSSQCSILVKDCDPSEYRRIDGSCNNLNNVTKGASYTPSRRLLGFDFTNYTEPRLAKSGNRLPLSRVVRTTLLAEDRVPSNKFTMLMLYFVQYVISGLAYPIDSVNQIVTYPYCCEERGKSEYMCIPNEIPEDDPVQRFSGIRCENLTRPATFGNAGCVPLQSPVSKLNVATPTFDLSQIYGNSEASLEPARLFEGGLLKTETVNNRTWPPLVPTGSNLTLCLSNHEDETVCLYTPDKGTNIFPISLVTIWVWRQHNNLAKELAELNPCWDDEQLFFAAREINIALIMQVYYYDALPLLYGRDNLVKDGIISDDEGFRDLYDESHAPSLSLEMLYAFRWFHLMQEGQLNLYDVNGSYVDKASVPKARTGWLGEGDRLVQVTQGAFRQASGASDYVVDPEMAEAANGDLQKMADAFTYDLEKGRYYGFKPYVSYLEYCNGKSYTSFEDLSEFIDEERIQLLKKLYETSDDIDLMAGIWAERPIEGGAVPPTVYCLSAEQFLDTIVSDRHWYERQNRTHAFTAEQLAEIRKYTVSRLVCRMADEVSQIQPNAFLLPGEGNEIGLCEDVTEDIDMTVFTDPLCSS